MSHLALPILAVQNAVCIAVAFRIVMNRHVCQPPASHTPAASPQRCCKACERFKFPEESSSAHLEKMGS